MHVPNPKRRKSALYCFLLLQSTKMVKYLEARVAKNMSA